MKKFNYEFIYKYCSIADDVIEWTIKQEVRAVVGGGTVCPCCSKICSGYLDFRCTSYGSEPECLSLAEQAEKDAREQAEKKIYNYNTRFKY